MNYRHVAHTCVHMFHNYSLPIHCLHQYSEKFRCINPSTIIADPRILSLWTETATENDCVGPITRPPGTDSSMLTGHTCPYVGHRPDSRVSL